jgi:hypothetical protein
VVAVTATLENQVYERLLDRLRHAEQYAEAARLALVEAFALLETVREEDEDDG